MAVNDGPAAPPLVRLLTEVPRGATGFARLPLAWHGLGEGPQGDGRPVMLLPGLFNGDRSNAMLARHLRRLGYDVAGWELGRNLGQRTIGVDGERLFTRIAALCEEFGEPVTLVGVSLGGIMARIAALRHPEIVRAVVTVSAPFAGPPTATNLWRVYELLSGARIDDPEVRALSEEAARALPVPATAIWSPSDGLVSGAICRDGECRAVEVRSSHLWVQFNPDILRAVAQALAGD